MEIDNWLLAFKIVGYWLAWLGIIYLLARRGFKKSSYNWDSYQDYTSLGSLFCIMKNITIYAPIISLVSYLTYLLFKP